ncbi:MAG TPA: hypothetical protein VIJ34_05100 [Acidimicrobiales bacterium]
MPLFVTPRVWVVAMLGNCGPFRAPAGGGEATIGALVTCQVPPPLVVVAT